MRRYRVFSAAVFAIVVSALVGGFFGRSALATQDRVAEHYRVFSEALDVIEREYVHDVDSERLVYSAIRGMLETLDPHSSFMTPRDYAQMRERQQGTYYGLGITISVIDGDITVVKLFEGSPAYRKGIRRGDIIARIEGEDAKGWTSEQAVRKLRGPKGSLVNISIRRYGYDQLIDLAVPRDEIHIPTIYAAFMADPTTGYVRLQDFAENTDRDLTRTLRDLKEQGMRRLLLDLRSNPGGPLDQAIKVANKFLPKGDMIVYTRGRVSNSDQDYHATEEGEYKDLALVVLVNRNSASASEIVSGAIQDHDRGIIVGETTFGKALVQSVYRISQNAGLALTTARYYTPSGRLIQRPWDGTFDEYLTYTLRDQDANRPRNTAQMRYTDAGRKVFGGGGIEPDRRVDGPIDGYNPTRFGRQLWQRQAFASFARRFSAQGDERIKGEAKGRQQLARGFEVDEAMLRDFKEQLEVDKVKIDEEAFAKDRDFIRAMLKFEIDVELFGVSEAYKNLTMKDPQTRLGLTMFTEAENLTQMARNRANKAARR
ncbi:MAG: S41 family peptidase [Acidobacteria bacterium]|nr:S41 family peptidase [Acidobacteriota bacterium]